jgi:hypothetical protein
MRQYVIDDIRTEDYEKLKKLLDETVGNSGVEGIYWIQMPVDVLTPVQESHLECQPYYFAIELATDRISAELLVLSRQNMRCPCMGIATEKQRNRIIDFVEKLLSDSEIIN